MATYRRKVGDLGESVACQFLEKKGFTVVERNFNKPWGEVDIIAVKGGVVRFVEVKTVSRDTVGGSFSRENGHSPEEMAHSSKLQKVARTAELYMDTKGDDREYQVDVVTVILDANTRQAKCTLYEQVL